MTGLESAGAPKAWSRDNRGCMASVGSTLESAGPTLASAKGRTAGLRSCREGARSSNWDEMPWSRGRLCGVGRQLRGREPKSDPMTWRRARSLLPEMESWIREPGASTAGGDRGRVGNQAGLMMWSQDGLEQQEIGAKATDWAKPRSQDGVGMDPGNSSAGGRDGAESPHDGIDLVMEAGLDVSVENQFRDGSFGQQRRRLPAMEDHLP